MSRWMSRPHEARPRSHERPRNRTSWCLVVARRGRGRAERLERPPLPPRPGGLPSSRKSAGDGYPAAEPSTHLRGWERARMSGGVQKFRTNGSKCGEASGQCGAQPRASRGCIGPGRAWDAHRGGGGSDYGARTSHGPQGAEKVRKKEGGSQTHAHRVSRGRSPLAHHRCGVLRRGNVCGRRAHLGARRVPESADPS